MKVMAIAGFMLEGGREVNPHDVLELPDSQARMLIATNRVVPFEAPTTMVTRDTPPAMTTREGEALVAPAKGRRGSRR